MAILDTNHDRAALIILGLGAGLIIALSPFATGVKMPRLSGTSSKMERTWGAISLSSRAAWYPQ